MLNINLREYIAQHLKTTVEQWNWSMCHRHAHIQNTSTTTTLISNLTHQNEAHKLQ